MISRTLRILTLTLFVASCGDGYGVDDDYDLENQNSNAADAGKHSDAGWRDGGAKDAGSETRWDGGGSTSPRDAGGDASWSDAGGSACATLTYESWAKQFFTDYCVSCHSGSAARAGVRLDSLSAVQARKAGIKTQVTSGSMPQGNKKPTDEQRAKLGAWVDCGAL